MMLRTGDRVRVRCSDGDVTASRYGYIDRIVASRTHAFVFLDDEIRARHVPVVDIVPVHVSTVDVYIADELLQRGEVPESAVRGELIRRWGWEADDAGLNLEGLVTLGDGTYADLDTWALAELNAGGAHYLLRAHFGCSTPRIVHIHAVPHYPGN